MNSVTFTLNQSCSNPLSVDAPADLVDISSGKAANEGTKKFLLGTLEQGRKMRLQFENECSVDSSQFFKPVARTMTFDTENVKESKIRKLNAVEGVRDVSGRILAVVAKTSDDLFLLPIVKGLSLKTDKATLTTTLESRQETKSQTLVFSHFS